jgi:outer membrane protein, multidrug efflux system
VTPRLGLLAAVLALAGCALRTERMTLPPPSPSSVWREGAADGAWPAAGWWRGFGSAELDGLIAKAGANNDDLAAAIARVREADAQARIAGAPLLPSITVSPDAAAVRRHSQLGRERHYGNFTGTFNVAYELDIWGKNHAVLDAAQSSAAAARYARDVVELTVVSGVATLYIQALELEDETAAAAGNLATAKSVLSDVQDKRRTGLATDLDVVRQKALVDTLAEAVPPLQAQLAAALSSLATLTAQPAETMQITGRSLKELRAPSFETGLPSQLLLHRPDVQAAERQLAAANANITVARAQFLPSFNLTAQYGFQFMTIPSTGPSGPDSIYNLALDAVQPVFEGGRLQGGLELARGRYAELLADYIKTTRQAYGDVEDALAYVRESTAQQAASRAALDESERALGMTRSGYSIGVVNMLAVLTAQAAVYPNSTALAQAQGAYLQSLVALYKALGGGWGPPAQPPAEAHRLRR